MTTRFAPRAPRAPFQKPDKHEPRSRPCILCIDDDPELQATLELRLRSYEVTIEHAYYGMQGIVEAVEVEPDVILMDYAMPHGDGHYVLDCLRSNPATNQIPILVLSGMRDPAVKRKLLNAGAAVFLQKPLHFDDLLHHLSRYVDFREVKFEGEVS